MTDWARTYNPTWTYTLVDRDTWGDVRMLDCVVSCNLKFDRNADVCEDGSLEIDGELPSEPIVRVYLDVEQDGAKERVAVATLMLESLEESHGTVESCALSGFGCLMAVADDRAPLLQTAGVGTVAMAEAARICSAAGIAPVVESTDTSQLDASVTADPGGSWLDHAREIAAKAGYAVASDGYGRTVFPRLPSEAMAVAWTFRDDGRSVLVGDVRRRRDLRKVPNYCEVRVTNGATTTVGTAVNDDPASPVSTVSRGRRVPLVIDDPEELSKACSQAEADAFAARKLAEASRVACTVSYEHDFVPVRAGDRVRIVRGSLDVLAVVDSMNVECDSSCAVSATASYEESYWEAS